ncbi:hypothetical protein SAMN06269250_1933 [Spirosoma fluviale]|uniref:Uncharacterized protein n=1 Tax=Spirosoma fluviale TaxID=1597977 RepID=A0A286FGB2_9BACT|nr:hypothetical protein SAMN06269250_1933 [Spirosoma fluviale]
MLFTFSTINKHTQIRNFSWWFNNLEFAFDAVSLLTLKGCQIITIELHDDGQSIQLPADAFDGHTISSHIKSLENEWIELLNESINMR